MKKIRSILGVLLAVASVLAAAYVGVWVMFVGGIVQGIEGIKATPVSSIDIAFGVLRVVFAGFVGYLVVAVGFMVTKLVEPTKSKRKKIK
ncbi:hypothetical protein [Paenibacillus silvae]|uniref:Uncharacterized protein n=1 Tax=Paenibacillus silvae TaxID=1325358 RepID=A0A2W6PGR1_9BACL|nr:hypothetical protein [Paenibacillus silvae]PZT57346.1 hypothetical protein DN757_01430 [Paenibacillus silvae]